MSTDSKHDDCFRCGYDLHGIADDHPCPECGLLAERSRRATDELHETRPKWLLSLRIGVDLILSAVVLSGFLFTARGIMPEGWMDISTFLKWRWGLVYSIPWWNSFVSISLAISVLMFLSGILLMTRPEGYPPADLADRRRRRWLRAAAIVPVVAAILEYAFIAWLIYFPPRTGGLLSLDQWRELASAIEWIAFLLETVGCISLPILLFLHLRSLAKRARSAHLAEHCLIVGIGVSISVVCVLVIVQVFQNANLTEWGRHWVNRSESAILLLLLSNLAAVLFILWSLYLLVRFGAAFGNASKQIRYKWRHDDRAVGT